jgi:hypothetical protein
MYLYSGYIECGGSEADYEFVSEDRLDGLGQLAYLLDSGMLQIMDNIPERI